MADPLPLPLLEEEVEAGPVLVSVDYALAPGKADAFLELSRELRRIRRRTGAIRWHLHRDVEDGDLFIETFPSWARGRSTNASMHA